ncbi:MULTISPECIES: peptidoglycan-binding protein [unclassified Streptomyces]|uniref:peptidoglycan-binding protein n=1 Tax=unclassified Streptomyces TaxID=2593676 RepID=UPI0016610D99|nr:MULTISPECIES: peptidoglycan-binding protein [unclassified Streptomyces]MBD0707401.1 N-acetylmuramoyl-L-alanine amidase [Streptomyces sp. CBMA291]MBD0715147.1 N-acetylmuramoyl-L-alanine amidase [Streptomyces sp. CBMA370]
MSAPLTAARFLAALRAEGLAVVTTPGWETHNRNHKGPWGPVHGVMIHHSVTRGTETTVRICRDGHSTLPGPLCHGVIAKDGTVHLVGYGRTNHAGLGDDDVLQAVIAERPLPPDDEASADGNRHFYGFECENLGDGKDPWPKAQLDAIAKVSAALCRAHGWGHRSVIGHLEWQPGKVDPKGFTMDSLRTAVAAALAPGPTAPATKPPAPTPPAPSPAPRPPFPGRGAFAPGQSNADVERLGRQLVKRGFGRHYRVGPSRQWGEADRQNVRDFQRSRPELRGDADGYPGPLTWHLLFS